MKRRARLGLFAVVLAFAPTALSDSVMTSESGFASTNACPLVSQYLAASGATESHAHRSCRPVSAVQPPRDAAWKVKLSGVGSSSFDQSLPKDTQVLQLTPNELLVTRFLKGKPIDIAWNHSLHSALHYCQKLEWAGFTDVIVYLESPTVRPGLLAPEVVLAEWFAGAAILYTSDESGIASLGDYEGVPEKASLDPAFRLLMQGTSAEIPLNGKKGIGRQFQWKGGMTALQQELLKTQWTNFRRNATTERYLCSSY
ncbi:hypothetical protein [Simiduia agarivorans]|uniref:Uncharacterized protein n=1 Tax=Simiduia agarivorans (strain DSM 21679 / JCM 13881 / BCRC 17597 / SA1) TaxID=1117647 RepID=K4KUE5_SIMAS|nr:hypothetical protein [Simiduia agarivorans]AFU97587.2 hypothetical protein M5M_01830 [Simiduia agarivorans SA1 = DSM 21679]